MDTKTNSLIKKLRNHIYREYNLIQRIMVKIKSFYIKNSSYKSNFLLCLLLQNYDTKSFVIQKYLMNPALID